MKSHKVPPHTPLRDTPLRVARHPLYPALLAASACSLALPAQAVDFFWNGTQSQSWFNGANWTPVGPPAAADNAIIDTISPNTTLVDNQAATVTNLTVGQTGNGTLQIVNGGSVTNQLGTLGEMAGSLGAVTVTGAGSLWDNQQNLFVGSGGSGTLNILNGGQVNSSGASGIGLQEGSDGTVLISGAGSNWTNSVPSGALTVGGSGAGTLLVVNGGTVNNTQGSVGQGATGSGHVTVSGMGSLWDNSSGLGVGNQGYGEMFITAGGQVLSASGTVGNVGTATVGLAEVSGMGSNWTIGGGTGSLSVGAQGGTGTLNITDGGAVFNGDGTLGNFAGHGEVLVTGLGSNWILTGDLIVGRAGSGDLLVEDQAAVSSNSGMLGELEGSVGEATVIGANSTWSNTANLTVGNFGSGILMIANGGTVSNGSAAFIGRFEGSEGAVSVSGAGSTWSNATNLVVGGGGTAELTISDGALVSNVQGFVGLLEGSQARVTVTGANSLWSNSFSLWVAQTGEGALHIDDGGRVDSAGGFIALTAEGVGGVTVTGPGSVWNSSEELFVGNAGAGSLSVADGGLVNNTFGVVGAMAGAQGAVQVSGADSLWSNSEHLFVGGLGQGQLVIADQGMVSNSFAVIGLGAGSNGAVDVSGAGSHWSNSEHLFVGAEGAGALSVLDGGLVSNSFGVVGIDMNAQGAVSVSGAGSLWSNSEHLFIGAQGEGALDISDGGQVSNTTGVLGLLAGSQGSAMVTGSGSTWDNSLELVVGAEGEGVLNIAGGGTVNSSQAEIGFDTGAAGVVSLTGAGSVWNIASNLTVGSTGMGALIIEQGGQVNTGSFSWIGANAGGVGEALVQGPGSVWSLDFATLGRAGEGTLTLTDSGTLTAGTLFVAQQAGSTGTLNIGLGGAPGILDVALLAFGDGDGTLNFDHNQSDFEFISQLSGAGTVNVFDGHTILTADSALFAGDTAIQGGNLQVEGSLGGQLVVLADGTLSGNGTVGTTTVHGTLAPGASIGTLNVDGDVIFEPGSVFAVEIDEAGNSDLLAATGSATLNGGEVQVTPLDGVALDTPYTLLTAGGGVFGTFDGVQLDFSSLFLTPTLSYDPNTVLLLIEQTASFDSVALTKNQAAAAGGADSLGPGHPLWNSIVILDAASARAAFDAISGEIHASTLSALLDESRHLRQASFDRLFAASTRDTSECGAWGQLFGVNGELDGNRNAAELDVSSYGLFLGGDCGVDGWRLGGTLGYQDADYDLDARRSSSDVESAHLAGYAGSQWDALALRLGAGYSWHRVRANRRIEFPGFSDATRARYDADTAQLFAELGYRIEDGDRTWEPFAGLAWVQVDSDSFRERGGAAALVGSGSKPDVTLATLGLRAAGSVSKTAQVRGMLAWQHASGDTDPDTRLAFPGGQRFAISGVPIGRNSALVDLGVDFTLGANARLGFFYIGRHGSDVNENGARLVFSAEF